MANIPGTHVPAITWTDAGFVPPAVSDVLAGVQADLDQIFSASLNYQLTTPQGQLATTISALVVSYNQTFTYWVNQIDPAYSTGRTQDAIGRIYFMTRLPALPTTLQVACAGLTGVVIPAGSLVQDGSGNLYSSTLDATIPLSGTVTVEFDAVEDGPTAVPAANGVSIYQAVNGWDSATVVSGIAGRDVESRYAYEARRQASVAANSIGSIPAIRGAVLAVPGVVDCYVTDNDTGAPVTVNGVTIAAHSVYVAAAGGTDADVARAIWTKKAPGSDMTGNTTVSVQDTSAGYTPPYPTYSIKFQRPTTLQFVFHVDIATSPFVPSDAVTQIQTALLAAFAGDDGGPKASIGSQVYASRYVNPVAALGAWAQVRGLTIGSNNSAGAVVTGRLSGTTFTVDSVTSGTVAVGQFLSDAVGAISAGTRILSQSSGAPGGVGVYVVSLGQTIGATFTGTGSGTNLTASAVTGIIAVGDVVTGTGVPGSTTIVSQTSGTPGGAGVYVTNNATTSSGASLKASDPITLAAADQASVSVRIDQEPALTAANIWVSVT